MTTPKFTIGHQMSESGEQHTASAPSNLRYESGATPKFTPGPWMVLHDGIIATLDKNGWEVADVHDDVPEYRANEHLIAAAPELYEAMCDAVKTLEKLDKFGWDFGKLPKYKAVLSKARGEG